MATISDIDLNASVRKYLERQVVVPKTDIDANQADEIAAILEEVAIALLLHPQAALTLILLAKNQLQQVVAKDLELLDFIRKTFDDVANPIIKISDTSDLVEAQTALVELGRVGNFQQQGGARIFRRYNSSIQRFLNNQLAPSVKRRKKGEFERNGNEARQDLFNALGLWSSTHSVMIGLIADVAGAVADFQSVDLGQIVSTTTLGRVRSSLKKIKSGIDDGSLSHTVAAVELLSGSAALQSISLTAGIYDPTIDSGSFPAGHDIRINSEDAEAALESDTGPWGIGGEPTQVEIQYDEPQSTQYPSVSDTFTVEMPRLGRSGRVFVLGESFETAELNLGRLFLRVEYIGSFTDYAVDLSSLGFTSNFGAIQTTIATDLAINFPDIECYEDGTDISIAPQTGSTNRILLVGGPTVVKLTVLDSGPGTTDGLGGYFPPPSSEHSNLGFQSNQTSEDPGVITPDYLAYKINSKFGERLTATNIDGKVRIASKDQDLQGSVRMKEGTSVGFGFDINVPSYIDPAAFYLSENDTPLDPVELGLYPGAVLTTTDPFDTNRSGNFTVKSFDGTRILVNETLLARGRNSKVKVIAPSVAAVQDLETGLNQYLHTFDEDVRDLQRVTSPLLSSRVTLAQINDAKRVYDALRAKIVAVQNILIPIVVRDDQADFASVAKTIIASLEDRSLDLAKELLIGGKFSQFFALETESASKGGRFMKAMEDAMTATFSTTTVESEQADAQPSATIPDGGTIKALEPSEST